MLNNISLQGKRERRVIFCFLFFPVVLLCLFGIWPIVNLIYLSFTSWNGISESKEWVGLANYLKILQDPTYVTIFKTNLYYLVSGLLQMVVAMYFAIILSFKTWGQSFFRASFILPLLISGVAISMMFRLFFTGEGAFDQLLTFLGLEKFIGMWLGDPERVNYTLAGISLWRNIGRSFLLYLGAIQSIDPAYYKVAEMEGATFWHKVRYIILPNITTVLTLDFILLTIGVVSVFEMPFILMNGSNGTATVLVKTMKLAFDNKKFGMAASLSVLLTLVIALLTIIQRYVVIKRERRQL